MDRTGIHTRWQLVQEIFHRALEQPDSALDDYLAAECAGDGDLLREVQELLAGHRQGGLVDAVVRGEVSPDPVRIGDYEILEKLGEGGMGSVYRARREGEGFTQTVALKLLRPGYSGLGLEQRLAEERRILGHLNHPGIARLIDGGTTPDGIPYFAMEFVEGRDLFTFCRETDVSVRDRLRIFCEICHALDYAHKQLVIHRDIKPGNIIVGTDQRPRLLDFGIAKLVDPTGDPAAATRTNPWMTPAYAGPEQVRGAPATVLSDIYSMGVMLYEMLTGELPYRLQGRSPSEVERIVCELDPEKPSARVGDSGLRNELSGDLDNIVLKSLAKDPTRRYESARRFAEDIERHLTDRPVLATPDSTGYRLSKFVRRHKTAVIAALMVAASLLAGITTTAWQARRASEQREIARDEAETAQLVTGVMVDLFRLSDPTATLGDTVTARDILDQGVDRISRDFGDQPVLKSALFSEVAKIYANLGLLGRAESLQTQAVAITEDLYGPTSLEVTPGVGELAKVLAAAGRQDEAIDLYRRAIGIRTSLAHPPDSLLAEFQGAIAWELRDRGDHDEAAARFDTALALQKTLYGPDDSRIAETMLGLAATHHDAGRFDEAEQVFHNALSDFDTLTGRPHPGAATALINIGMIRRLRQQYIAATPLVHRGLEMREALYQPGHPDRLEAITEWGNLLSELGRYPEAFTVLSEGAAESAEWLGDRHPRTSSLRQGLANVLTSLGRYDEAIPKYDRVLAEKRERYGGDHPDLAYTLIQSGEPHLITRNFDRAEAIFSEALAISDRVSGERSVARVLALQGLARVAAGRGQTEFARRRFDDAIALGSELLRPDHRYLAGMRTREATFLLDQGQLAEARALYTQAYETESAIRPAGHRNLGRILSGMGEIALAGGDLDGAETALREAISDLEQLPRTHWEVGNTESVLGAVLLAKGDTAAAAPLLNRGYTSVSSHLGPEDPLTRAARTRLLALPVLP